MGKKKYGLNREQLDAVNTLRGSLLENQAAIMISLNNDEDIIAYQQGRNDEQIDYMLTRILVEHVLAEIGLNMDYNDLDEMELVKGITKAIEVAVTGSVKRHGKLKRSMSRENILATFQKGFILHYYSYDMELILDEEKVSDNKAVFIYSDGEEQYKYSALDNKERQDVDDLLLLKLSSYNIDVFVGNERIKQRKIIDETK